MKRIYAKAVKRVLISTFIVLFSMVSFAATYYVSNTGSDSNSGISTTLAWKTLAKVNATTFVAGDQVLFQMGGTWAETLTISSSGSSASPIAFGSYGTGNKPIITGSDSRAYTVNTNNKSYITIDGFNLNHALGSSFDGSINVGSSLVQGVTIKNCTIENNRRCGIVLKGSSLAASVTIDNCVIQNNGQMGILVINAYTSGQISNNQFLGNGSAADQDAQQMSNIQGSLGNLNIFKNTIYNAAPGSVTYSTMSHGIYVSTATTATANIHDNIIYGNLSGAGIKLRFSGNIYNNTIYGNRLEGIEAGGNGATNVVYSIHDNVIYGSSTGFPGISESATGTGTISMYIYNNTLYKSGSAYSSTKEISVADNLAALTVKNNVFYAANSRGGITVSSQSNAIIDYNLYWKDTESGVPNNIYNGTTYSTLASWRTTGFDAHGLNANPLLVGPTSNFQLQSTSPAINAGVNVGLTTDFNGSAIVGLPDIGAFESGSTSTNDVTVPIVTVFTIPATSTSLTVSLSTFIATDNIGVTGYLLTETSTTPTSTASGWSSSKPMTYIFTTAGSKTLYAWAKDAAGNVSASLKASVTVTSPNATTFTFTGPSNGNVNNTSTNFTVTPNYLYTGTITITPTGTGSTGLSAKVFTFSNSSGSQSFTLTPTVAGSITLTPTNNSTLINPANLTYTENSVVPGAPTSIVAVAGNANASVTFVAPTNNGGSAITGYSVTSIPTGGTDVNAGSTSLTHSISGLTNGTSYTFTVKATNSVGTSIASAASNSVIPKAPLATTFTFTGPTSGNVNSTSTNFSVTPNNLYTGTITVTPTGTGSTGLSAKVFTFSNSSTAQTITITPTVAGCITLTAVNSGTLTNPANIIYTVNAIVQNPPTGVYYVSNTGSDANSGLTTALAWKTLAKVNATAFTPGNQILLQKGGTWAETLTIPSSGSSASPIVFGAYGTGNQPIITGSDTRSQTLQTNNKSYVTVDGLNLSHAAGTSLDGSVSVGPSSVQGVVIKNCTIENNRRCGIVLNGSTLAATVTIDNCVIQTNGQMGILVINAYTSGQISNNQFRGNGGAADQDAHQISNIQGNLGNIDIFKNTIYNAAPGAVTYNGSSHGIYASTANSVAANIHDNIIYGNLSGAGIKVRFSANIYNNTIYGNRLEGIEAGGNGATNAVYMIYNNIIYGSTIGFPGISESGKGTGSISMYIYNNTLYKNCIAYPTTKEINVADNLTALTVKNNVFYAANSRGGISLSTQSNAQIDYNLYWKDTESGVPNNVYNGTTYSTLASWRTMGFDTHGLNANPLLVSPTSNFQLQSTSPGINAGVNVGLTTDITGNAIVGLPDIGAFESGLKSADFDPSALVTPSVVDSPTLVKIEVFPNPSIGKVTVRFSSLPDAGSQIDILDISGRKVASRFITGTTEEFDLANLPTGLYLVKSILGSNERTQKLILKK